MLEGCKGKEDNVPIEAGYPFEPPELKESLKTAAEIEEYEAKNIYPSFARVARDEGFVEIAETLTLIAEVENTHFNKLKTLAEQYKAGRLYKSNDKTDWTCSNCGHHELKKEGWQKCPLCTYPQGYIMLTLQ